MSWGISINNNDAVNLISKKPNEVNKSMVVALKDSALFIEGEVKSSIAGQRAELRSVDTGRFLNSVTSKIAKDYAVIYSDVPYAKFLEFGTSRFKARMHFRNTVFRNQFKVKEIFIKAI